MSWAFDAPIYWDWLDDEEQEARGSCNEDFCAMRDDAGEMARFVRGTIEIPIVDAAEAEEASFVIGAWSSLSEVSFEQVLEVQERDEGKEVGPWFGWLSNRIPVYPDTLNLETLVHYREGLRPVIEIKPGDHPLTRDAAGIRLARALELAEQWYHLADVP